MAVLLPLVLFSVTFLGYALLFVGRRARNLPHGEIYVANDTGPKGTDEFFNCMPTNVANYRKPSPDTQERNSSEVGVQCGLAESQLTRPRFTEWAKQYGGMFSLKLGIGTAVVLTDRRLIKQLLDKKSNISSDRPPSFVSHDLITGGDHLLVMQYGNTWRSFRKLIHQYFMESMVEKEHIVLQNAEAVQMIHDYMLYPEEHMRHPKRYSNSIIMSLLYGIRTPTVNTSHMTRLYDLMENWSIVMEPGNTPPVDIYPFLHWIPESIFGNWRSRASNVGDEMNKLYSDTLNKVDERRKHNNMGSFMDRVLDQNEKLGLNRHELYFLGGACMEGGSDTSSSIIIAFVQAMTKFPEVLKKAHKEVDSVLGEDRSPVWSDYEKLPYIATCVKEAQRWRPVVPIVFPHTLTEDDRVDGKLLPKGTIIFINVYGLHHDESKFPNPDVFDPDHYKGQTTLAPELASSPDYDARDHYGYGAGRRLCPGIHVAERNLFLAIAKLVWAFDFRPGRNANGKVVEPDIDIVTGYSEGSLVCAKPFACDIQVRSEKRRETILREYETAEREVFSKYQDAE